MKPADKPDFDHLDPVSLARAQTDAENDCIFEDRESRYFNLVQHLRRSRTAVEGLKDRIKVGVVCAMWQENSRILPRSHTNPSGEDCIVAKGTGLEWLFQSTPATWHLYAVDDGCPTGSFETALEAISDYPLRKQVSVLRLADALPTARRPLSRLKDAEQSTKGGAIILGCLRALEDGCDFICYTDCDNSVHMGQAGLLLEHLVEGRADVAFGDRLHVDSNYYWAERDSMTEGEKFLIHMRNLLPKTRLPISDIASPFKMFSRSALENIIKDLTLFDFSFDLDIVLSVTSSRLKLTLTDYSFLDSYENSAWHSVGSAGVWFQKLNGSLAALQKHELEMDEMIASIIEQKLRSIDDVREMMAHEAPPELRALTVYQLGDAQRMSVSRVKEWADQLSGTV